MITGMTDSKRIVAIAPEHLFEGQSGNFINLRHPSYDDGALFYLKNDDGSLWEVQRYKDKYRSWFIGNTVKSDGSIYFLTPFDPLFLAIQYLKKKTRFSTLDTVLEDSEFPDIKQIVDAKRLIDRLHLIADVKTSAGFQVALFSESKTLKWLESQFYKVEKTLKANDVSCQSEGASQASSWKSGEASEPEAVRQYAFGILTEYLADDLTESLGARLGIQQDPPEAASTSLNDVKEKGNSSATPAVENENGENGPPKAKKRKSFAPSNDYQETFKQLVDVKKEAEGKTAKPKLKKQPGMQSITNFFGKK